jgi:hypothetical protein
MNMMWIWRVSQSLVSMQDGVEHAINSSCLRARATQCRARKCKVRTVKGEAGRTEKRREANSPGACERSLACSTCHVILDPEIYDKLPEPEDEENDMLDLAFALEDT